MTDASGGMLLSDRRKSASSTRPLSLTIAPIGRLYLCNGSGRDATQSGAGVRANLASQRFLDDAFRDGSCQSREPIIEREAGLPTRQDARSDVDC